MLRKCKILIVFILMLSSIANSSTLVSASWIIEEGDFRYTVENGEIEIYKYIGSESVIEIPSMLSGLPVTSIGASAFSDNELTSVTIPSSVTRIEEEAFRNNQLTSVIIPESVTSIGRLAFSNNELTSITIPGSLTKIEEGLFSYNKLTDVNIPNGVTSIEGNYYFGGGAFQYNELTSVTLPESVTSIGINAFRDNALTSLKIPEGVTKIGADAFRDNALTSVIIPESATDIGGGAFSDNRLTSVTIPESITEISDELFRSNNLTSVIIPKSVTVIGGSAFSGNNLTSVEIPESVTEIEAIAFEHNELTSVTIPESVTSIGFGAFSSNNLTSVTIPDGITRIEELVFSDNKLTEVIIPNGVTSIGEGAFRVNKLMNVTLPESLTTIGATAFSYNNLTGVEIPQNVTVIEDQAFWHNQLKVLELPDGLTKIGSAAFMDNQLTSLKIPNSVKNIEGQAFYSNNLTDVVIGNNVKSIGDLAFARNQLTSVKIPSSVTSIGNDVFADMKKEWYIFEDWYIDQECTRVWDQSSGGVTIYAKKIDSTPPKLSINQVSDKDTTITGSTEGGATVKLYLNGVLQGTTTVAHWQTQYTFNISKQKAGVVVKVVASDAAGNEATESTTVVDKTAPALLINQVSDQSTTITGTAEAKATVKLYLNGVLENTIVTDSEGQYTFNISKQKAGVVVKVVASDAAGNETTGSTTVVDKTAPTLFINQVSDKSTTITGTTEAEATVKLYLNGVLENTTVADSQGQYTFNISKQKAGVVVNIVASDAADNETEESTTVLDDTAPVLSVNQVSDKSIMITGTTEAGATVELYLNGKLEDTIEADSNGEYAFIISKQQAGVVVKVVASDAAKNETVMETTVVDKTAPVVKGVKDQAYYNKNIEITFDEGTATLNGKAFKNGTTVSADGKYQLVVTDSAGNVTNVSFTIDKTAPIVTGVKDQGVYEEAVTIIFNEGTATLNGKPITSGSKVKDVGEYELVVIDAAGNKIVVGFSIKEPVVEQPKVTFSDVLESNRFYNDINYLVNKSIISGYTDGTFRPNKVVTRSEAAIMIGRALGLDGTQKVTKFSDVGKNSVASGYIQSAVDKGIIQGFPDGTFKPNEKVTRGQMAIFLSRAFNLTKTADVTFSDVSQKMVAYPHISKIVAVGITFGYSDNTYRPNEACTRGQFSAFLSRALK